MLLSHRHRGGGGGAQKSTRTGPRSNANGVTRSKAILYFSIEAQKMPSVLAEQQQQLRPKQDQTAQAKRWASAAGDMAGGEGGERRCIFGATVFLLSSFDVSPLPPPYLKRLLGTTYKKGASKERGGETT